MDAVVWNRFVNLYAVYGVQQRAGAAIVARLPGPPAWVIPPWTEAHKRVIFDSIVQASMDQAFFFREAVYIIRRGGIAALTIARRAAWTIHSRLLQDLTSQLRTALEQVIVVVPLPRRDRTPCYVPSNQELVCDFRQVLPMYSENSFDFFIKLHRADNLFPNPNGRRFTGNLLVDLSDTFQADRDQRVLRRFLAGQIAANIYAPYLLAMERNVRAFLRDLALAKRIYQIE